MRKIKYPKIGELVLVTHWADRDPMDPWNISTLKYLIIQDGNPLYVVSGCTRWWRNAFRITEAEALDFVKKSNGLREKV